MEYFVFSRNLEFGAWGLVLFLFTWGFGLGTSCFSQQDVAISQYYYNPLAVNPGYCGIRDALNVVLLNRNQWVGFNGAPATQSLTMQAPFFEKKVGLGIQIINDKIGFRKNLAALTSVSYKLILDNVKISFGLRGGIYRFQVDKNSVEYDDPNEPGSLNFLNNKTLPSFDFGIYLQSRKFFAGGSSSHINQPKIYIQRQAPEIYILLNRHYFVTAGYIFPVNENFRIIPSFLLRAAEKVPTNIDFNTQVIYKEKIGAGMSYRTNNTLVYQLNFSPNENLKAGYSFDYSLLFNKIKTAAYTHEIFISYDIIMCKTQTLHPKFL